MHFAVKTLHPIFRIRCSRAFHRMSACIRWNPAKTRLGRLSRNPWHAFFTQPLVRWAAFAAITASLTVGFIHHREVVRERAAGEAAKERLMLALRIAGSKLQMARAKVNQINADDSTQQQDQEKE